MENLGEDAGWVRKVPRCLSQILWVALERRLLVAASAAWQT